MTDPISNGSTSVSSCTGLDGSGAVSFIGFLDDQPFPTFIGASILVLADLQTSKELEEDLARLRRAV